MKCKIFVFSISVVVTGLLSSCTEKPFKINITSDGNAHKLNMALNN